MKFPIFVKYSVSRTSAALSGSAMGRQQRSSRENRWIRRGTLFGGTQAEIQD